MPATTVHEIKETPASQKLSAQQYSSTETEAALFNVNETKILSWLSKDFKLNLYQLCAYCIPDESHPHSR